MTQRRTLLVIDDDADIRATLADVFEDQGYDVVGAANGREALDVLAEGPRPDVILLDIMMPVMDGWEFRAVQRQTPVIAAIPVVVVSASGLSAEATAELGVAAFLRKPLRLRELIEVLRRVAA